MSEAAVKDPVRRVIPKVWHNRPLLSIIRPPSGEEVIVNGVELISPRVKPGLSENEKRILEEMGAKFYPRNETARVPVIPQREALQRMLMMADIDYFPDMELRLNDLVHHLEVREVILDKHGKDDGARDAQRLAIHSRSREDSANTDSAALVSAYESVNKLRKNKLTPVLNDVFDFTAAGGSNPYLPVERAEHFLRVNHDAVELKAILSGKSGIPYDDREMDDKIKFAEQVDDAVVATLALEFEEMPVEWRSVSVI